MPSAQTSLEPQQENAGSQDVFEMRPDALHQQAGEGVSAALVALKAREKTLAAQYKAVYDKLSAVRQKIAEASTFLRVGDTVKYKDELWALELIRPGYKDDAKFFGRKLKKDGTPGGVTREMWFIDDQNKPVKVSK